MTDLARAFGIFRIPRSAFRISSARSSFGNVKPSRPSPPTLSACRREKVVAWNPAQAKECFGGVMLALAAFILSINDGLKPKSIRPFSTRILRARFKNRPVRGPGLVCPAGVWSGGMKGSLRGLVVPTVAEPPGRLRKEAARKGGRQTFDRRNTNGQ